MGPQTVNTIPPKSLDAFRDHGIAELRLATKLADAHKQMSALSELGVDLAAITDTLEADGLQSFSDAFDRLMDSIAEKRKVMAA